MNAAWELRVAGAVDVEQLSKMSKLPTGIVSQFVQSGASCVGCDLDGKVLAFALVNTFKRVKDKAAGAAGGLETTGEIMKVHASAQGKAYVRQTVLGSLKLLKGLGASEVRSSVGSTDGETMTLLTSLGLGDAGRSGDGGLVTLKAALFAISTDPGKKIDAAPVARKPVAVSAPPAPVAEQDAAEPAAAAVQ